MKFKIRPLIEVRQDYSIECDNPKCDYMVLNLTKDGLNDEYLKYLNQPCPLCGENLLTEKDAIDSIRLLKIVRFFNKWFSWLNLLFFWRKYDSFVSVKVHNGVHVDNKPEP